MAQKKRVTRTAEAHSQHALPQTVTRSRPEQGGWRLVQEIGRTLRRSSLPSLRSPNAVKASPKTEGFRHSARGGWDIGKRSERVSARESRSDGGQRTDTRSSDRNRTGQLTVRSQPPSNRRAQLTVFIIVGLFILIAVSITLYLQGKAGSAAGERFLPVVDEVPVQFAPLRDFVDKCLQQSAEDGLRRIGLHGGYIGLSAADARYTKKTFDVDSGGTNPTAHGGFAFSPGSDWAIPYWYYLSADNACSGDCTFAFQRPPLYRNEGETAIEAQLDRYVQDRVVECLGDWKAFSVQGISVKGTKAPQVKTVVGERDVRFYLTYPLEARDERGALKVDTFGVTVDINLLKVYNLATEILNVQSQHKILEANTMNIIAGMSGLDENALPPVAATEFSATPRFWAEQEVKQQVQDLLTTNTQLLTVAGTRNFQPYAFSDPVKQGIYQNFIIPVTGDFRQFDAEFTYLPIWQSYFDAGPGVISSSGAISSSAFSWIPIKQYNTPYDISYPVVVEIADPIALRNNGYSFFFALEANIRNNQAINESFIPLQKASLGDGGTGQFCNANQRNSGEITITAKNISSMPVAGAAVFFTAGTSCLIGSTNASGIFTGRFPIGIGALTMSHPDYATRTQFYATKLDVPDEVAMQLFGIVEKPLRVEKMNIVRAADESWSLDTLPLPLAENEQAIVTAERVRENPYDEEFTETAQVRGDGETTLRLIPGRYKVDVQLIAYDTYLNIPKTRRCGGSLLGKKCVTIPRIKVTEGTFYAGSLTLDGENAWEVTPFQLYRENTLTVYAMNFDLAGVPESSRRPEDMEVMGAFQNYARGHYNELKPRFG